MTKTEQRMKGFITENTTHTIDGVPIAELATGAITVRKREMFVLDSRETGFRERGVIFNESSIAEHFPGLFMQMFPARFDMILRVAGSMFVRKLNELNIDREIVIIDISYGIGVENDTPISYPIFDLRGYGFDAAEPIENASFQEVVEIIAENLELLTDTFLSELKNIAELERI